MTTQTDAKPPNDLECWIARSFSRLEQLPESAMPNLRHGHCYFAYNIIGDHKPIHDHRQVRESLMRFPSAILCRPVLCCQPQAAPCCLGGMEFAIGIPSLFSGASARPERPSFSNGSGRTAVKVMYGAAPWNRERVSTWLNRSGAPPRCYSTLGQSPISYSMVRRISISSATIPVWQKGIWITILLTETNCCR